MKGFNIHDVGISNPKVTIDAPVLFVCVVKQ